MENKEYPYLYMNSAAEAKRYDELDRWRESHRANVACKKAIEDAIRRDFDGMYLKDTCVRSVLSEYGFKRTEWVLANTVQQKPEDDRFRPDSRKWANAFHIPRENHNSDFVVESHSEVLNGFIQNFRQEFDDLRLFGPSHCESMFGQELTGKVLVLSTHTLKESYWTPENQLWLATGGFGCVPNASGRAVFATCLGDGERTRWNREDFTGILKEEFLPEWAKEHAERLRAEQQIGGPTSLPHQIPEMDWQTETIEDAYYIAEVNASFENEQGQESDKGPKMNL